MSNELIQLIINSPSFNRQAIPSCFQDNRVVIESILYALSKDITIEEIALLLNIEISYIRKVLQMIICSSNIGEALPHAT